MCQGIKLFPLIVVMVDMVKHPIGSTVPLAIVSEPAVEAAPSLAMQALDSLFEGKKPAYVA